MVRPIAATQMKAPTPYVWLLLRVAVCLVGALQSPPAGLRAASPFCRVLVLRLPPPAELGGTSAAAYHSGVLLRYFPKGMGPASASAIRRKLQLRHDPLPPGQWWPPPLPYQC